MNMFRGMDDEELKAAYDNTAAIPDFPNLLRDMQHRSEAFYLQQTQAQRDIAYGKRERMRLDYLPAGEHTAPTFIFIHGGYWRACTKEDFAFVAQGPLSIGCHVILLEYTLAPQASMTQIVEEIKQALDFIQTNEERFKIQRDKVCLSGHSAGGHLTAMHRNHPVVSHTMPISALVDLLPIQCCWLNDALSLTDAEVELFSPIRFVTKGVPTQVVVGGSELPELIRHSEEYDQALYENGNQQRLLEPEDCKHFSVLDELAQPDGQIVQALEELWAN